MRLFDFTKHNLKKVTDVFHEKGLDEAKKELVKVMKDESGLVYLITRLEEATNWYVQDLENALNASHAGTREDIYLPGGEGAPGFSDYISHALTSLEIIAEIIGKIIEILKNEE